MLVPGKVSKRKNMSKPLPENLIATSERSSHGLPNAGGDLGSLEIPAHVVPKSPARLVEVDTPAQWILRSIKQVPRLFLKASTTSQQLRWQAYVMRQLQELTPEN